MFIPLSDDVMRQYSDSRTSFLALREAIKQAKEVRGGMIWRTVNKTEYLIRTAPGGGQKGLGRRSPETEAIYRKFSARKSEAESRVASLKQTVAKNQRLNQALYVGRTPKIVIDLLNLLAERDLIQYFTVVGTYAMYAYETAAGVRIENTGALATQDVDLLWHTGKRLQFMSQLNRTQERSMIQLLRKLDPTFKIAELDMGGYTATNAQAFQVDFIRGKSRGKEPHPIAFSDEEDDLYPVPAHRAEVLMSSPKVEVVVVSARGEMAIMPTISPYVFYQFKQWMSQQCNRVPEKRQRDRTQAELALQLVHDYLPQYLPKECDTHG